MTTHYGNLQANSGYPVAAWIWGHRLREGQHWMEYLLEFLNVLVGFDYELCQGVDSVAKTSYKRLPRLGLRRFVFYDGKEKTRHPRDDRARQLLMESLRQKTLQTNNDDPLVLARQLLRSYSAVEEKRSWFAKSLFPAHQNLLFWEALRKGATGRLRRNAPRNTANEDVDSLEASTLDLGITFGDRNFFARGGEIYYLILSAGSWNDPARQQRIANRLRLLLSERNQEIGDLAAMIDDAWQQLRQDKDAKDEQQDDKSLGWIPFLNCGLYPVIAEDVDHLLQAELDPLESLDLLAHLICFHIIQYIYHRADTISGVSDCSSSKCMEKHLPLLLVDCMDGSDGGIIRQISAALYKSQEQRQIHAVRTYVSEECQNWAAHKRGKKLTQELPEKAENHFDIGGLNPGTREEYERKIEKLKKDYLRDKIERTEYVHAYSVALTELLMDGFNKHFIGIHRKLARNIGFVAPRAQGSNPRYVLSDTLLKAVVLANVSSEAEIPFDEFLAKLYSRYGLVVGPNEARASGLYSRRSINVGYYDANRSALLLKMKSAGLLREYSDATAMVRVQYG